MNINMNSILFIIDEDEIKENERKNSFLLNKEAFETVKKKELIFDNFIFNQSNLDHCRCNILTPLKFVPYTPANNSKNDNSNADFFYEEEILSGSIYDSSIITKSDIEKFKEKIEKKITTDPFLMTFPIQKPRKCKPQKVTICSCGSTYTKFYKNKHFKSKKHRTYVMMKHFKKD